MIPKREWQPIMDALHRGDPESSLSLAKQFVAEHPRAQISWTTLGRVQKAMDDYDGALASFRKALEFVNPKKEPIIWAQIGIINRKTGALIEAEEAFREALKLSPLEGGLHILLGGTLAKQGRLEEAKAHHRKAIDLGTGDTDEAFYNLALIARYEANIPEALDMVEQALQICPDYQAALDLKGELKHESTSRA